MQCPAGGRKGNQATRDQNEKIAKENEAAGAKHTSGGKLPEQFYPNPDGFRKGGRYSDVENTLPDGTKVVTQTVNTDVNGVPTDKEVEVALDIYERLAEGDTLTLVPKNK